MTPKERAAMQQALEALVKCNHFHDYEDEITALREALAKQAEQEPVAYRVTAGCRVSDGMQVVFSNGEILYAAPVRTKDLTDDEILEEYRQSYGDDGNLTDCYFARAVIAADREKNK